MKTTPLWLFSVALVMTGSAWAQNSDSLSQAFSDAQQDVNNPGASGPAVPAPVNSDRGEAAAPGRAGFPPKSCSDAQGENIFVMMDPVPLNGTGIAKVKIVPGTLVVKNKTVKSHWSRDTGRYFDCLKEYGNDNWHDPCQSGEIYESGTDKSHYTESFPKGKNLEHADYFDGCGGDAVTGIRPGDTISLNNIRSDYRLNDPNASSFSIPQAQVLNARRSSSGQQQSSLSLVLLLKSAVGDLGLKEGDTIKVDAIDPPAAYFAGDGGLHVANGIEKSGAEASGQSESPLWRYGYKLSVGNALVSYSVPLPEKYANCLLDDAGKCKKTDDGYYLGLPHVDDNENKSGEVQDSEAMRACQKIGGVLPAASDLASLQYLVANLDDRTSFWSSSITNEASPRYPTSYLLDPLVLNERVMLDDRYDNQPEVKLNVICRKAD